MAHRCFEVSIENEIAHLRLNRPDELNTMVPDFWRELPEIVRDIDMNAKARVIVISSTGRHFSAGMALDVFSGGIGGGGQKIERGRAAANMRGLVKQMQASFDCLEEARMPVLMAVQGGCVGGAVDFAAACDIRWCTEDAFFVIQEINLGMTADVGTFPRLCHVIPSGFVREMAYAGRRLPARVAKEIGLVNEIFATQDAMLDHVMGIARDIAEKSPLAVHGSKVMINYARDHSVADALDYIALWQAGMYNPETDMREAFEAKAEKRTPQFQNLAPVRRAI